MTYKIKDFKCSCGFPLPIPSTKVLNQCINNVKFSAEMRLFTTKKMKLLSNYPPPTKLKTGF